MTLNLCLVKDVTHGQGTDYNIWGRSDDIGQLSERHVLINHVIRYKSTHISDKHSTPIFKIFYSSLFKTFAVLWMLYSFFLGESRCINFMFRCFGTPRMFRLHTSCVYSFALKMVALGLSEQKVQLIRLYGVTTHQMEVFILIFCRILNLTSRLF
jgi:hypothetical protein